MICLQQRDSVTMENLASDPICLMVALLHQSYVPLWPCVTAEKSQAQVYCMGPLVGLVSELTIREQSRLISLLACFLAGPLCVLNHIFLVIVTCATDRKRHRDRETEISQYPFPLHPQ